MSNAKEISDADFKTEVLDSPVTVLVDFWAPWCGPCRMIAPIIDQLAEKFGEKLKVVKLNVDENPNTAGQFGIMSIPTLLIFKGGKNVGKLVGAQPANLIEAEIAKNL